MPAPWLASPPSTALWVLDDTLSTLNRLAAEVSPPPSTTVTLMTAADEVCNNQRLWTRLPSHIGSQTKEAYRARLRAALDNCRGFN